MEAGAEIAMEGEEGGTCQEMLAQSDWKALEDIKKLAPQDC
jgi:hypothetical protein